MEKSVSKNQRTHDLWKKDLDHLIHPYTNFKNFPTEGSVVYD